MIKRFFFRTFCGIFLGFSIFAPGISGSVVAIAMGVYQDIVRIASNPFKDFKKNALFLAPILVGAIISAVGFVLGFNRLIGDHQKAIYMLFIGLIAGNLPLITAEVKRYTLKASSVVAGVVSFALAIVIVLLSVEDPYYANGDGATTASLWLFGVSGLISGMTALIPGMSVATILIVVGIYAPLIYAAENLFHTSSYALPIGLHVLGIVIGLVLASRGIKKAFDKFPGISNTAVLGFMAGSLVGMTWIGLRIYDPNFSWWIGGLMLLAGLAISMMFLLLGKKINPEGSNAT